MLSEKERFAFISVSVDQWINSNNCNKTLRRVTILYIQLEKVLQPKYIKYQSKMWTYLLI